MLKYEMTYLRTYVEDKITINDKQWEEFFSLFRKKTYKKGEDLLTAGEMNSKFFYISSGIVRTYSINTLGDDTTWTLHVNYDNHLINPFAGNFSNYHLGEASDIFAEALCECVVYEADFTELNRLFESSFLWMKLGKKIFEDQVALITKSIKMFKNLTAKERYLLVKEIAPIYEEILPNYQFATVIGVAPQSLSRIKQELKH